MNNTEKIMIELAVSVYFRDNISVDEAIEKAKEIYNEENQIAKNIVAGGNLYASR